MKSIMIKNKKVPDLRFWGLKSNWLEYKFDEIYSFRSTNSLSRDKLNYDLGEVRNIHYGDIHTKFQTIFDITKEKIPFINNDINLSKIPEDNYCKEKDLAIADASENYSDIGKCIELINLNKEKVLAGLHTFLARPDQANIAKGFGGYLMQSYFVRKQIMFIAQGTKVLGISTKRLAKIDLVLPDESEQQKIANFLIAIDQKIQQLTKKQSLLIQYKKGVMQQIFSQEIRFKDEKGKEFRNWEEKRLIEVCIKIQDGNYGGSYPKRNEFVEKGIPFLTSKAIGKSGILDTNKIDYVTKEKHAFLKKAHLKLNDVLFTNRGASVGTIGFVDSRIQNGNIGPQLTLLRSNLEVIIPQFLKIVMITYKVRKQIQSQDSGSAMNFFGISATSKFKVYLPPLPEQQKIANFLIAIDEKKVKVKEQITQMQAYKKGLLQQLFV